MKTIILALGLVLCMLTFTGCRKQEEKVLGEWTAPYGLRLSVNSNSITIHYFDSYSSLGLGGNSYYQWDVSDTYKILEISENSIFIQDEYSSKKLDYLLTGDTLKFYTDFTGLSSYEYVRD